MPENGEVAVHLLLGDAKDPWCLSVRAALEARNYPTRIVSNPLLHPSRFAWRLSNEQSCSQLISGEEPPLHDNQIASVFLRSTGFIDAQGWQQDDLSYIQSETQAALLAWLWSLDCPVINRYTPAVWYRPQAPLLSWQPLLRRCGLPALEMLVTNVEHEARKFGQRLTVAGAPGAVYGPLTSPGRYLLSSEEDWTGIAAMQRFAPVCLSYPYGAAWFVCVIGQEVVWEGDPPPQMAQFEAALRCFAAAAGLAFVELAFAASEADYVIHVEPHPDAAHFGDAARQKIVEAIVELLTRDAGCAREGAMHTSGGSHS